MIFYRSHAQTFATESLHVGLQDDVMALAQAFEPEFVMAEHAHENTQALQAASNTWAGVGLVYPDLEALRLANLQSDQAKVFLLAPNDPNQARLSECALVVHEPTHYQRACIEALNNILT